MQHTIVWTYQVRQCGKQVGLSTHPTVQVEQIFSRGFLGSFGKPIKRAQVDCICDVAWAHHNHWEVAYGLAALPHHASAQAGWFLSVYQQSQHKHIKRCQLQWMLHCVQGMWWRIHSSRTSLRMKASEARRKSILHNSMHEIRWSDLSFPHFIAHIAFPGLILNNFNWLLLKKDSCRCPYNAQGQAKTWLIADHLLFLHSIRHCHAGVCTRIRYRAATSERLFKRREEGSRSSGCSLSIILQRSPQLTPTTKEIGQGEAKADTSSKDVLRDPCCCLPYTRYVTRWVIPRPDGSVACASIQSLGITMSGGEQIHLGFVVGHDRWHIQFKSTKTTKFHQIDWF